MSLVVSRPELESKQLERLQNTVHRVAKNVIFYKDLFEKNGIEPNQIRNLEDLAKLPFTTKTDLRDNYPLGMVAHDHQGQVRRVHASSGTRGKPTLAWYTQRDLEIWTELCARSLQTAGVSPGDVVQNSYGYGLFTGGLGLHQGAEALNAIVVPASSGRSQHQVMLMQDIGVNVLCCTPSYALTLANYIEEAKIDRSALKLQIGIFGAEPWSEECRQILQEKLGIKAYDIYGLSEILGPGIAVECREQNGLHIWEDHFLIEIVDNELVITTLSKQAMPLLRYRTGDSCSIISDPCPCGLPYRRITRLQGRIDDMLIIKGVNVFPSEIESVVYAAQELGPEYQIVVDRAQALDRLTVRVEIKPECDEPTRRRAVQESLEDALRQRLGLSANVEVVHYNFIPRSEGKAVRVLDMRGIG